MSDNGHRKRCHNCGEVKPVSEFHSHPTGKYGVESRCKVCKAAADRRRRRNYKPPAPAPDWKGLVGKRERKPAPYCYLCNDRDECTNRVHAGLWVKCERPDEADLVRLERIEHASS